MLREQDQDEEEEEEGEDEGDDEDEIDEGDQVMSAEEKKKAEKQKQRAKHCTVLVELLQKNRRQKDKTNFLYIGFHVYKVGTNFSPSPPNSSCQINSSVIVRHLFSRFLLRYVQFIFIHSLSEPFYSRSLF